MSNMTWDYTAATTLADDFPQLAELADVEAARAKLGAAFGERIERCEVYTIRYIAGRALEAVYRLGGDDLVTVRFLRPGQSVGTQAAAVACTSDAALVAHLPAWDAVAWRLPADPGNLAIPVLLERTADLAEGAVVEQTILSYLPGERCAVRCTPQGGSAVVGKLRAGPGAAASHAAALRLWRAPGRRFLMPEPLAADEACGMRWERFVPGLRLEQALATSAPRPVLAAVARGLSELHALDASGLPPQGPDEVLKRVGKVLRRMSVALPELVPEARGLAVRLTDAAPQSCARPATLHGDLHTANVIVSPEGPVFIDLDSLAAGDPAFDLALLGSRLILSAACRDEPLVGARSLAAALPRYYGEAGGDAPAAATFAWYVAALLLARQVKTCIRNAAPEARRIASALLIVARETLERQSVTG